MFARLADPEPIATVPAAVSCWDATLQHEVVERDRVLGVSRGGLLPWWQRPLRLAHGKIQRAQMQLVVVGMKQHVAAEAKRAPVLVNLRVERELVLFVGGLRRDPRKMPTGDRHERRRRVGLNLRLLEIEVRHL